MDMKWIIYVEKWMNFEMKTFSYRLLFESEIKTNWMGIYGTNGRMETIFLGWVKYSSTHTILDMKN